MGVSTDERRDLLQRVVGQRPQTTSYYATALAQIEQKKHSWNWAAALLGPYWMLYHRAFWPFWIGVLVVPLWKGLLLRLVGGRGLAAAAAIAPEKLWRELCAGNWKVPLLLFCLFVLNLSFWMLLWGRFGNHLLFWSLHRKKKAGYFALPSYRSTERGWMILSVGLIILYCVSIACVQSFTKALAQADLVSRCILRAIPMEIPWGWSTTYASPKLVLLGQLIGSSFIAFGCFAVLLGLAVSKTIVTPLREWNQVRRQHQEEKFLKELASFSSINKSFQESNEPEKGAELEEDRNLERPSPVASTENQAENEEGQVADASADVSNTEKEEPRGKESAPVSLEKTPQKLKDKIRSALLHFLEKE